MYACVYVCVCTAQYDSCCLETAPTRYAVRFSDFGLEEINFSWSLGGEKTIVFAVLRCANAEIKFRESSDKLPLIAYVDPENIRRILPKDIMRMFSVH